MIIEPHLDEKPKYVIIWVSNAEKDDADVKDSIRCISTENHKNKIKTVIFQSGTQSLPEQIAGFFEIYGKKTPHSQDIDYKSVEMLMKMCYNICAKVKQQ